MIHTETVHPSQLRRAMASYANQGYPPAYGPHPYQEGMMVVIITLPDDADIPDWRDAPPRRRVRFDISPRMIAVLVAVALIVGVVGYAVYSGFTVPTWGEIAQGIHMPETIAQMFEPAPPRGEPVVEKSGWHWPWESSVVSKPAPRDDGFRWPWDDAAKQVSDTVDMVKNVTLFVVVLLLLGVALWFVAKVKGVFK